jgi:Arc/MetJ family transcription regulator
MARTTVNVDETLLAAASEALGTTGVTETVNAALAETVRRARLADFSVAEFDITDEELAEARADRATSGA